VAIVEDNRHHLGLQLPSLPPLMAIARVLAEGGEGM